ncbi:amino acid ABC transporter permease [Parafrigoribacterium mesophilum]|uniref:amino acid ABC transporter permease n=1 Tax=Parafrigoribacterium mesophilum TaxID=433646 RepID=UPI0031FBBBE4
MSVLYDAPGPKSRRRSLVVSIIAGILILGFLAWVGYTLASPRVSANGAQTPGMFSPTRTDILSTPVLWQAFGTGVLATLQMAAVAAVLAIAIGILFSFARTARSAWIRTPTAVILEFFRGMPVLLMMLFILLVFAVGPYWSGVGALAVYNGALIGESLRAGIQSLPRGQREGGLSIGLTGVQTRMLIEFPQAFRQMLPIIIAQLVVLLKDTSLAYVVGYPELSRTIKNLQNFYGNRYLFTLFAVGLVIYLVLNLTLSWIARYIARRSGPKSGALTPEEPRVPGADGTQALILPLRGGNRVGPPR